MSADSDFRKRLPGVWRSPWRDNYDAARLMLLDMLRSYPVEGDPVVMTPNRDTLLLTGSDDDAGLVTIAKLAEEAMGHARSVSGLAARLDGETWLPFLPPASASGLPEAQEAAGDPFAWSGLQRAPRRKRLDALYETSDDEDDDVFVGSFTLMQHKDTGAVSSYAIWSDTIVTLLPRTELVAFFRGSSEKDAEVLGMFPWERVESVVGELMTRVEMYPPRWRVAAFPSAEQFAKMRE